MKVLAKDLKHGQRFRRSSEDAIAAGLVDSDGCAIAIHAVAKRTLFIPGYIEVELIDPPAEPESSWIPQGVYFNAESGNFYNATTFIGMGTEFATKWWSQRSQFPTKADDAGSVEAEPEVDPGEGYRLLRKGKDPERKQEGDEYMNEHGDWVRSFTYSGPQSTRYAYRRRIDPTYRPYTDAELLEQLGAKVRLKSKDRSHGRLITDVDLGTAVIGLERVSAEALRNKYEHLDGTACGVEE